MSPPMPRSLHPPFLLATAAILALGVAATQGGAAALGPLLAMASLLALAFAWRRVARVAHAGHHARTALLRSAQDTLTLLRLTESLQRCRAVEEVAQVVEDVARRLLPGAAGTLRLLPAGEEARALSWGAGAPDCGARADACPALRQGRMQVQADHRPCPLAARCGAALCLPVAAEGAAHGVLLLGGDVAPRAVQAQKMALAVAEATAFALETLAIRESLRGQALRDPLTGLHNRRFLDEAAEALARQATRREAPLAVAMLDVDHFKRLNDGHGHAVGDAVLRDIGALLSTRLRRSDIACRYGGEEFLIVLPDCDAVQAWGRMDALRRLIVARRLGGITGHRVTCSIGVAALGPGADIAAAIADADQALYDAKRTGRNRVVVAARHAPAEAAAAA